jgi:hypothetical protein
MTAWRSPGYVRPKQVGFSTPLSNRFNPAATPGWHVPARL